MKNEGGLVAGAAAERTSALRSVMLHLTLYTDIAQSSDTAEPEDQSHKESLSASAAAVRLYHRTPESGMGYHRRPLFHLSPGP